MVKSLKSKIIFLMSCVVGITAGAVLFYTHRDVGQAMLMRNMLPRRTC